MPSEEIVKYGEAILRNPTEEVTEVNDDIRKLIDHMVEVLYEASGVGLAANQIGIPKRIFVYDVGEGPGVVINPKITKRSGEQIGAEGCLSIPGLQGDVTRANVVTIEGLDREGNRIKLKGEGLLARVFQHETDHLDGYLFIDKADPDTLMWGGQEEEDFIEEE